MALSRSEQMSRIRGRDTVPEITIRHVLWSRGIRYRVQRRIEGIRPDLVFGPTRLAVFIDGCFWHGCPDHYVAPRNNNRFWAGKLTENLARDRRQTLALEDAGWRVLRIWEHEVEVAPERVADRIEKLVSNPGLRSRIPLLRVLRVKRSSSGKELERVLGKLRTLQSLPD